MGKTLEGILKVAETALCPLPFRKRPWYLLALVMVVVFGLASRRYPGILPAALGKYPGDALWALMVFLGWGIVFPKSSTVRILLYALVTSYCVELGKLYQAPWINHVRDSTIGHLIFGSTFSWGNMATPPACRPPSPVVAIIISPCAAA